MKDMFEKLKEDHRLIHTSAKSLECLLEGKGTDKFTFLREIKQQMRVFSDRLEKHFEYEESIGKFDEVMEETPRLTSEVKGLLREHKDIVEKTAALSKKMAVFETDVAEGLHEISREFRQLHAGIEAHERKEMDLLHKAFFTDVSESD